MKVKKTRFGTLCDGSKVTLYTVSNGKMSVSMMDYGCTLTSILVPNGKGGTIDVLVGRSTLDSFINGAGSHGGIVGRFANRISNARFTLDGKDYGLDVNSCNKDCLHGGFERYEKMLWSGTEVTTKYGTGVKFTRLSCDGEQGFPGNVALEIYVTLNDFNELTLKYVAVTDKATPINITNHAYFNLAGRGTVLKHTLKLACKQYLEVDDTLIPTGKLIDVAGTPFDFTKEKQIGKDIADTGVGYDHCYVTPAYNPKKGAFDSDKVIPVALLKDPESGRSMTVSTNQIGIQVYSGNFMEGHRGKNGIIQQKHDALCLETQCFPDSPNKKSFPSCILQPGDKYKALTTYKFIF
ncbi:MAG: galactose mutarotase [Treponema sp.]|nr:galactose mutarotase [Treponema sp.]